MCLASGKLVWNAHPLATTSRQMCNEIEPGSEYVEFYLQANRKWWWKKVMKKKSNFIFLHTKVFNEVAILLWTNSFRRLRRSPENNLYLSALF